MNEPSPTSIEYRIVSHPNPSWDVMQVVWKSNGRTLQTIVLAEVEEKIMRRVGSFPEEWEVISDKDDEARYRQLFIDREKARLANEERNTLHGESA